MGKAKKFDEVKKNRSAIIAGWEDTWNTTKISDGPLMKIKAHWTPVVYSVLKDHGKMGNK